MRISDWSSDVCSSDLHAAGDAIGIKDDAPIDIAGGAANGLDQRRFGAQETFLVRVQNSHKAAFGNVQTFPQQVDADKHIIHSQTQIADKLEDRKSTRLNSSH